MCHLIYGIKNKNGNDKITNASNKSEKQISFLDVITDPFAKSRKVYFKDEKIAFDGVPFSIIGSKVFDCQHGPDRKKAFKARQANEKVRFCSI